MNREQALENLLAAALLALNQSRAFAAACADLPALGMHPIVRVHIEVNSLAEPTRNAPEEKHPGDVDAKFLRSLRIDPDLEAR